MLERLLSMKILLMITTLFRDILSPLKWSFFFLLSIIIFQFLISDASCFYVSNLEPSDVPVTSTSANVKPSDGPTQKITQAAPTAQSNVSTTAQTSKVSVSNPESGIPTTPAKGMNCWLFVYLLLLK